MTEKPRQFKLEVLGPQSKGGLDLPAVAQNDRVFFGNMDGGQYIKLTLGGHDAQRAEFWVSENLGGGEIELGSHPVFYGFDHGLKGTKFKFSCKLNEDQGNNNITMNFHAPPNVDISLRRPKMNRTQNR
jgi:hypothetical protein